MNTNNFINIGENIKKTRKKRGFSQKQLAQMLDNMPVSTLANYENNHREPSVKIIDEIANVLNVPIDYLLGYTEIISNNGEVYKTDELLETSTQSNEKEIQIQRIEYLKKLYSANPLDQYISNIYERYLSNNLTKKDREDIDDYMSIQLLAESGEHKMNILTNYEVEAHNLFLQMLNVMGYTTKSKFSYVGLFKMVKSQIEFAMYISKRDKFND